MTEERNTLASLTNCGVCGRQLVYATEPRVLACNLCGQEGHTLIYCPEGHYVCDACHSKAGIAVSVLTNATPLTGKPRSLALAATSSALARMLDDQPRCCKRASRIAVGAAVDFLKERLNIVLPDSKKPGCIYTPRNKQCARGQCPFFDCSPARS